MPGGTATQWVATTYGVDHLRYLTSIAATFGTGGMGTTVYNLTVTRDVEGNVLDNRYAKANGRQGDWFELDGFDRPKESKLGVTGFSDWTNVQYDTRTAYGLDSAQNRTQVDTQAWGQGVVSTQYTLESNSNRYLQVGTSGFTYDGNGNLISDGWYVYAYDYLDRLSEVYLITYPAGATGGSLSGTAVYGPEIQRARRGKRTGLSREAALALVERARARRVRLGAVGFGQGLGGAGLNQNLEAGVPTDEPVLVIVAWYGYDPMNRRVLKALPTQASWYGYDGWQKTDEYDALFSNVRVHLDGPGIDEHLGFANASGSGWTRYTLVQSNLGHVVAAVNGSGQVVERYEYEPDGARRVFDGAGNALASTQIGLAAGFTGRDHDEESGLIYFRNRYYSAAIGRFVSEDPQGTWGDPEALGNAYGYVANRQVVAVDPLGLELDIYIGGSLASNSELLAAARRAIGLDPNGGTLTLPDGKGGTKTETVDPIADKNLSEREKWIREHHRKTPKGERRKVFIAHGYGTGGAHVDPATNPVDAPELGRNGKLDGMEAKFLADLARDKDKLDKHKERPIVISVCWGDRDRDESTKSTVCKRSRAAGGVWVWGLDETGRLDFDHLVPIVNDGGKANPGPFK